MDNEDKKPIEQEENLQEVKTEEVKTEEESKSVEEVKAVEETKSEEVIEESKPEEKPVEETKECNQDEDDIRSLGDLVNQRALAEKFISENRSLAEFKNTIKNTTNNNVIKEKKMEKFSIVKAIRSCCKSNALYAEAEYENSIINENKKSLSDGNAYDIVVKAENLRALGPSATVGNELINTQYLPSMFTPLDRPQTVIDKTGCTIVPVDGNPISFAITLSGTEAQMTDMDGNLPDTDMKFGTKEMKAKKMGACVPIPYSLLLQAKPEIDQLVTDDLLKALNQKKDEMALIGSGTNNEPIGVFATSGVNEVDLSGAFTLNGVYEFEKGIRDANIFSENLSWVMNSKNYYKYATTPKSAVEQNEFLIGDDRKLIGYPVYICNALDDDEIVLGDFSELLVANFDGLMLKVDDITYIKKQAIQIIAYESFDVLVRKPKAFSISKGA